MKTINTQDLAYIAGYIDGDGCFFIGKEQRKQRLAPKYVISIIISSVNKCTLESFKKQFGGSVRRVQKAHDNSKAQYHFSIKKNNSIKLIHKIMPYLVEKKEEAKIALTFAESNNNFEKEALINKMRAVKDTSNLVSKHHITEFEPFKNTINPTNNDFAYLAGFIDAECCFSIQKDKPKNKPNHTYKIMLSCNNTKAPVFKWLLERFGGWINFVNRLKTQKARKNQLLWRLTAKNLSKILDKIYPYLRYKKPVCQELINFYNTTMPNGGARHTETFRIHYESVLKIREDIVKKVHLLNLKGIKSL